MPGFREFLARFRPAGAPGPAVGGAVPADRSAELLAELEPPLALLDDVAAEAAAIRESALREAAERRRAAAEEAERIVRTARERARDVRYETAARLAAQATAEADRTDAAARHAAGELRERARSRTPELAARVVARVTAELTMGPHRTRQGTSWVPGGSRE